MPCTQHMLYAMPPPHQQACAKSCSCTEASTITLLHPFLALNDVCIMKQVPLVIVDLLVFVVYAMERANLEARMGVIVTLVSTLASG